jgi:hypothetical protein
MSGKHAYEDLVPRMPSDAEIEAAMRRARRERAETAHLLFRQAWAWLAGVGAPTAAPATAAPIRPGRIAAARH